VGEVIIVLNLDPVAFFGDAATLGTILIVTTWLVANLALPVYYRRAHPDLFNPVRHVILPLLGVLAIGFPLYELIKPGGRNRSTSSPGSVSRSSW
jgi:hypothetical protein